MTRGRAALELAISRQAVAEWRDRHILLAAALLNRESMHARDAFEREVEQATAADTLFNPAALANARIDALLGVAVAGSLPQFLDIAAKELSSIDRRLADIADALRRPDAIVMPTSTISLPPAAAMGRAEADSSGTDPRGVGKRGLLGVPARIAKRASTLADDAGSAADELLQEKLGLKNRLRNAAAHRVAEAWMSGAGEPKSPLMQLVALIDETTHAARLALS